MEISDKTGETNKNKYIPSEIKSSPESKPDHQLPHQTEPKPELRQESKPDHQLPHQTESKPELKPVHHHAFPKPQNQPHVKPVNHPTSQPEHKKEPIKEQEPDDALKKRFDSLMNWLSNPYNFAITALIIFAIILRIYFFIVTSTQALWWDEAEYMNIAKRFAFGLDYQFGAVRPIFFSFISSLLIRFVDSEFLPRVFLMILSIATIIGIYMVGSRLFNKRVGLISGFFMSVFYLCLFFTYRLIIDIPSIAFFSFAIYYFYRYFETRIPKYIYIGAIIIALGTLFKQSTGFFLIAILIYVILTEKISFLKKKEYYIAAIIFLLILAPYVIWGYSEYHGNVLLKGPAEVAPANHVQRLTQGAWDYLKLFPLYFFNIVPGNALFWLIAMVLIFGLIIIYFLKLILGFDIMLKKDDKNLKKDLFLLLMIIVPFILATVFISHNEDRYIINALVGVFILFAFFIDRLYLYLKKSSKILAIIVIAALLLYVGYIQYKSADNLIKSKISSYAEIRSAGIWMGENSEVGDVIVSSSPMQIQYYSNKKTYDIPANKSVFEIDYLQKNAKYFMLSSYEMRITQQFQPWAVNYPNEQNFTPVQAYFADAEKTQPVVIIYRIPNDFQPKEPEPILDVEEIIPSKQNLTKERINDTGINDSTIDEII